MAAEDRPRWIATAVASLAVLGAAGCGLLLRLEDPLSSPVIPAEDPFTHMAFVREHLRDGNLDPPYEGAALYPPGLHAVVAALLVFTGADLADLIRLVPPFFGAVGVLGTALLLWRADGRAAAVVGAFVAAVAPETIFRAAMMAPTALDLALLPFLLLAILEVARGRLAWLAAAIPLSAFLVFAHPWVFGILVPAGALFLAFAIAFPWRSANGPSLDPRGLASVLGLLGTSLALALSGCGGSCGPGVGGMLPGGETLRVLAPAVAALSLLPAAVLATWPRIGAVVWRIGAGNPPSPARRLAAAGFLLALLVAVTVPAVLQGMPNLVDLPRMFGWPILLLATLGLVLLPVLPSRAAVAGAAIGAATYGFVIYDPLHSPFWSHRTAVYLGIGMTILAGTAAGCVARAVGHAWRRPAGTGDTVRADRPWRTGLAAVSSAAVVLAAAGAVSAASPEPYPGWYRMFTPCQYDALLSVSATAGADPEAVVVTGNWRSKLVVAAHTPDASRVWFHDSFLNSSAGRDPIVGWLAGEHRTLIVVVDGHFTREHPGWDDSYLQAPPWEPLGAWCVGKLGQRPSMQAYQVPGGAA